MGAFREKFFRVLSVSRTSADNVLTSRDEDFKDVAICTFSEKMSSCPYVFEPYINLFMSASSLLPARKDSQSSCPTPFHHPYREHHLPQLQYKL